MVRQDHQQSSAIASAVQDKIYRCHSGGGKTSVSHSKSKSIAIVEQAGWVRSRSQPEHFALRGDGRRKAYFGELFMLFRPSRFCNPDYTVSRWCVAKLCVTIA